MSPAAVSETTGAARIALVADPDSFEPWDDDIESGDPLTFADSRPYAERLAQARDATGRSESVLTGSVLIDGRRVAVVSSEFAFMGGSIGAATGERIARAFDRARRERLPLVAIPASGGTRMQEGALALVQMAKLAAAARRLRDAHLPYLVYLTNPTTGGVLASWASLATVTFAEPGALAGFGGPRVVELMTGAPLPERVQTTENLLAHGLIDDVVAAADLRERVERVLTVAAAPRTRTGSTEPPPPDGGAPGERADAWRSLQIARDPARPSARDFLRLSATNITELRGDGTGEDDPSCMVALAQLRATPVVVIAQDRDRTARRPAVMSAPGYRKASRALGIARELGLPVVTIVDTPGAEMSVAAEEAGLSRAIAHVLADMSAVPTPTLAILLGEGGSGGALALLPADRVICAEHASLSPIAPEGASAILYRTTDRAAELARTQGIASWDLVRLGIADRVVSEADGEEPFLQRLTDATLAELEDVESQAAHERLSRREERYRTIGDPTTEAGG